MKKNTNSFLRDFLFIAFLNILMLDTVSGQTFVHPGGLHTIADLDRMKDKVAAAEHPWIDAWNVLITDGQARNTYTAAPSANIGGGARQRASQDAHAAYLNVIRWYVTGDASYADCAVRICNAWSSTVNQVASGELYQLPINNFMQAAELLRIYPGWAAADIAKFKTMALTYFYPACHNALAQCGLPSSWDSPLASSIMGIGLFCDDVAKFNEAVTYFKTGAGNGSILKVVSQESGQITEMGRDMVHANIGLSCLAEMCQTAKNQPAFGYDLYAYSSNRLLAGFEYYCQYNLNHPVVWVPTNTCDNDNFLGISYYNARGFLTNNPTFEMVYNHYGVLKGLSTPYVKALVNLARPETQNADFFGYGTFAYTLNATASPYVPYLIPAVPTNLTARPAVSKIYLDWTGPSGDVANGYKILRSTTAGGLYTTLASWTNNTLTTYTDNAVVNGTRYYYRVAANNQSGTSANSAEVNAQPVAATNSLPTGWAAKDIGSTTTTSSSNFSNVVGNTFVINGTGSRIGGTSDSFTYTYGMVTGDFTITVHMADYIWSWTGDKAGVMVRESLDPNAKSLAIYQGDTGNRFTLFATRNATGGNTTLVGGNKFSFFPWYRLQRIGNTFTASQSTDGISYGVIGTSTVSMNSICYVGMPVCSGASGSFSKVTYEEVKITGGGSTPLAPATLTGTALTSSRIKLAWIASSGTSSYLIKRSTTNSGPYTTVATTAETTYIDSSLVAGTNYYYVLKSENLVGQSTDSVSTNVQTLALSLPPVPADLKVEAGNRQAKLSWKATEEATSSYKIKRSTNSTGPFSLIYSSNTNSYVDNTAVNGSTYFYTVNAVNTVGDGNATQPVSVFLGLKLKGQLIGTPGSWNNNPATTIAAAVDSNLTTFFDANIGDGAWLGLNLGTDTTAMITAVSFAPRSNIPQRMVGGQFQAANQLNFSDAVTLYTVPSAPVSGIMSFQAISNPNYFKYFRYLSPNASSGNVAEVEFWGKVKSASQLFRLPVTNFKISATNLTCKGKNNGMLSVKASQALNYTATVTINNSVKRYLFRDSLEVKDLSAGTYSLCMTVDGQDEFQQCSQVIVAEPAELTVYSSLNENTKSINLELGGAEFYHVELNGAHYDTKENRITLPLSAGENKLAVTTDKTCQGVVQKNIIVAKTVLIYPNPFTDILNLKIENSANKSVVVKVYDQEGQVKYAKDYFNQPDVISLDLSNLKAGLHFLHMSVNNVLKIYKIIKNEK